MNLDKLREETSEQLRELRESWESGLEVVTEIDHIESDFNLLVVLKGESLTGNVEYHCHRYMVFTHNSRWSLSVDGQGVDADTALEWLGNPRTIPVGEHEG